MIYTSLKTLQQLIQLPIGIISQSQLTTAHATGGKDRQDIVTEAARLIFGSTSASKLKRHRVRRSHLNTTFLASCDHDPTTLCISFSTPSTPIHR
jgi:hypothetical protein